MLGRDAEIDPWAPSERPQEVLDDGPDGELSQGTVTWRAITRPAGGLAQAKGLTRAVVAGWRERLAHPQHVRHASEDAGLVEPVEIFRDQPEPSQQAGVLELVQRRLELGHEQRIVGRERGDELRVDGVVVLVAMAGAAGPPVAAKGLFEEQTLAFLDQLGLGLLNRDPITRHQRQDGRVDRLMGNGGRAFERDDDGTPTAYQRQELHIPWVGSHDARSPVGAHRFRTMASAIRQAWAKYTLTVAIL